MTIEIVQENLPAFKMAPKPIDEIDKLSNYWADWLIDAIATSTQNEAFLHGDVNSDPLLIEAIFLNGEKAIRRALEEFCKIKKTEKT